MATTATLHVHPAAEVFPLLSESELTELGKDIALHGLKEKITLWRAGDDPTAPLYVLDGRKRLEALRRSGVLGLDPRDGYAVVLGPSQVPDPAAFVISKNIRRRHLTKEQQAELILKAVEATMTDAAKVARSVPRDPNGRVRGSSKDAVMAAAVEVAAPLSISKRTLQRVRTKQTTPTEQPSAEPRAAENRTPAGRKDLRAELRRLLDEGRRRMKTLKRAKIRRLHSAFITWMLAELERIAAAR
jgi:hypothetical protein